MLFKNRRPPRAHLAFKQCRNRQKEPERPAQDQQYEQIAIRLRGNRERCQVRHEKTEKTIRKVEQSLVNFAMKPA